MSYVLNTSRGLLRPAAEAESFTASSGVCLLGSREASTGQAPRYQPPVSLRPFLPTPKGGGFSGGVL